MCTTSPLRQGIDRCTVVVYFVVVVVVTNKRITQNLNGKKVRSHELILFLGTTNHIKRKVGYFKLCFWVIQRAERGGQKELSPLRM